MSILASVEKEMRLRCVSKLPCYDLGEDTRTWPLVPKEAEGPNLRLNPGTRLDE